MDVAISIIAILVLLALLVIVRRSHSAPNQRPPYRPRTQKTNSAQFHAVSLKFTNNACDAARSMEGKRFISGAAPHIPLPDCDALKCHCRFVHHKDRRSGNERRNTWGTNISGDTGRHPGEKRHRPDRRLDDSPDDYFK